MDELLRDPLWTFVGVILAVLAVLVTVMIFFAQRKTKKLSYEITSNTQLLGVKDEIQGKVQVLYEGKEVKNVHLLTIKFSNNGNQSISSNDYERPLSIEVNSDAKVLTYEVIDEEPENLGAVVQLEENKIVLSPILLNEKDTFSIKALISDFEGQPIIDGRINGVKAITRYKEGQISFMVTTLISLVLIGFGALNLEKIELISIFGFEVSMGVIGGVLFASGYLFMLIGMLKNKRMVQLTREIIKISLRV